MRSSFGNRVNVGLILQLSTTLTNIEVEAKLPKVLQTHRFQNEK